MCAFVSAHHHCIALHCCSCPLSDVWNTWDQCVDYAVSSFAEQPPLSVGRLVCVRSATALYECVQIKLFFSCQHQITLTVKRIRNTLALNDFTCCFQKFKVSKLDNGVRFLNSSGLHCDLHHPDVCLRFLHVHLWRLLSWALLLPSFEQKRCRKGQKWRQEERREKVIPTQVTSGYFTCTHCIFLNVFKSWIKTFTFSFSW